MANERLFGPKIRIGLASVYHFADWKNPTVAELNKAIGAANLKGSAWDLSCALDMENTTFDLGDSDTDDELSFCQEAGAADPTEYNPEVVYTAFSSTKPYIVSDPASLDQANAAFALMAHRGQEYFAWMSDGKEPGELFAVGDRISLVKAATEFGINEIGTGSNVKITQTFGFRSDINWRYKLVA